MRISSAIANRLVLVIIASSPFFLHSPKGAHGQDDKPYEKRGSVIYNFVSILDSKDTDQMRGRFAGKDIKFQLLNVLRFSKWPKDLSKEQQKIKQQAEKLFKQWQTQRLMLLGADEKEKAEFKKVLNKSTLFAAQAQSAPLAGDLYVWHLKQWDGRTPAEKVGWGMFHFNILMIQEGLTVYQPSAKEFQFFFMTVKGQERDKLFAQAEKYAMVHKKGIWRDKALAQRLKRIAQAQKTPRKRNVGE